MTDYFYRQSKGFGYAFLALLITQFINILKLKTDPENEKLKKKVRLISILAFPFAMGIVLVPDGALFSFVKAREFWNRPLLLPHFANAALVSGVAVMIIIAYISDKIDKIKLKSNSHNKRPSIYDLNYMDNLVFGTNSRI